MTDLEKLRQEALSCTKCSLCTSRNKVVFGEGNPTAELMFIGEAPGKTENLQGKPFVGRSGNLLTNMIESIGLKREDVYIANILKCWPPGNRKPEKLEIEKCNHFLLKQIELIKPRVICTLGAFASQTLLLDEGVTTTISNIRGKPWPLTGRNIIVIPTFHPAYILRNSSEITKVKQDFNLIKLILLTNIGKDNGK